jgi:hypothetical protein
MLINGMVLIVLIVGSFIFLGFKISESIPEKNIKLFFFGLYFITILTVFNIIVSVYFYIKLKDKRGPPGKKGLKGIPGDKGVAGACTSDSKFKTLELMLKKYVENGTDINQIDDGERNVICNFIKILNENSQNTENLNLLMLKNIKEDLEDNNNEYKRDKVSNYSNLKNRISDISGLLNSKSEQIQSSALNHVNCSLI